MTLGAEIAAALPGFRAAAESRFSETLTFYTSIHGTDPDTLVDTDIETVIHADIPGQIKYPSSAVSESSAVGQRFAEQSVIAKVAVGATPNVRTDHMVRVVASTVDPTLVGRTFRVTGWPQSGSVTSHRYSVSQVS